jgi:hypothetical protein
LTIGQRRFHHGSPRLHNLSQAAWSGTAVTKPTKTDKAPFKAPSQALQGEIAYDIYGELESGEVPLIALLGELFIPHAYLLLLSLLLTDYDISVAMYYSISVVSSTGFPDRIGGTAF